MKYLVAAALIAFGFYVVRHSFDMVKLFGKADWAEKYLGYSGSYAMWKILGILAIITAFYVVKDPEIFGL